MTDRIDEIEAALQDAVRAGAPLDATKTHIVSVHDRGGYDINCCGCPRPSGECCGNGVQVWREDVVAEPICEISEIRMLIATIRALQAEVGEMREALAAEQDISYAHGYRAGWNDGVAYESCQEVRYQDVGPSRGNPDKLLSKLASMETRITEARTALKPTPGGTDS